SRKRACRTSILPLPSRTVYVRSSKQRESFATFFIGTLGPQVGVGAEAPRPCACAVAEPPARTTTKAAARMGSEWKGSRVLIGPPWSSGANSTTENRQPQDSDGDPSPAAAVSARV